MALETRSSSVLSATKPFRVDTTKLAMRFTLALVAALSGIQAASAICCYYGSVGACRRAEHNPLLRLRGESLISERELNARVVCCCAAGNSDECETQCVSIIHNTLIENIAKLLWRGPKREGRSHFAPLT